MAPFVEFDLAVIIHSTTESVRLYGTPVSIGGKTPNMLTVRSGRQTVSCRGLAVPGARNTHAVRKNDTGTKKQNYKNQPTRKQITPNQTTPHSSLQKSKTSSKPHQTTPNHTTLYKNIEHTRKCVEEKKKTQGMRRKIGRLVTELGR